MERKFNPGDSVYIITDPSKKLYIVELYEPAWEAVIVNALSQDKTHIPESAYYVTCYWMKGDEKEAVQFEEELLTKSSIG